VEQTAQVLRRQKSCMGEKESNGWRRAVRCAEDLNTYSRIEPAVMTQRMVLEPSLIFCMFGISRLDCHGPAVTVRSEGMMLKGISPELSTTMFIEPVRRLKDWSSSSISLIEGY